MLTDTRPRVHDQEPRRTLAGRGRAARAALAPVLDDHRRGDGVLRRRRGDHERAEARARLVDTRTYRSTARFLMSFSSRSSTTGLAGSQGSGLGLRGLRDRVEAIGGTFAGRQPGRSRDAGRRDRCRSGRRAAADQRAVRLPDRAQRARRELLLAQERGGPAGLHQLQRRGSRPRRAARRCPGWRAMIRRVASTPPMPGIRLSMITIRGASASTASIAASPELRLAGQRQPGRGGDEVAQRPSGTSPGRPR